VDLPGKMIPPYKERQDTFNRPHYIGLRDLNSARQNITEQYLLKCHEIFAVCCIGRAATDVGVMKVFELARQANLTNVGIVCTKSEVSNEIVIFRQISFELIVT
jgi:hypothetical protein